MDPHEKLAFYARLRNYERPYPFPRLLMWNTVAFVAGVSVWSIVKAYSRELYWDEHPGKLVPAKWPYIYYGRWEYYAGLTGEPDMRSAVLPPVDPDTPPVVNRT